MKRDWDLLRQQLTIIEDEDNILDYHLDTPKKMEGQTQEEYEQLLKKHDANKTKFYGHLQLLIEKDYIEGVQIIRSIDGHYHLGVSYPRLTMAGHDLLDTIRSKPIWESVKSTAKNKGIELTFDVIKTISANALTTLLSQ